MKLENINELQMAANLVDRTRWLTESKAALHEAREKYDSSKIKEMESVCENAHDALMNAVIEIESALKEAINSYDEYQRDDTECSQDIFDNQGQDHIGE